MNCYEIKASIIVRWDYGTYVVNEPVDATLYAWTDSEDRAWKLAEMFQYDSFMNVIRSDISGVTLYDTDETVDEESIELESPKKEFFYEEAD